MFNKLFSTIVSMDSVEMLDEMEKKVEGHVFDISDIQATELSILCSEVKQRLLYKELAEHFEATAEMYKKYMSNARKIISDLSETISE